MRVLLFNSTDRRGGAAKVGRILLDGLRQRGHEAHMMVGRRTGDDPDVRVIPTHPAGVRRVRDRIIHRLGINALSLGQPFPARSDRTFLDSFDILHLHDFCPFNLAALPTVSRRRPVVWTMHNMSPFTGGCLYAYDCERWKAGCGRCPQFGRFPLDWLHRDGSRLQLLIRRFLYARSRLHPVGVSEWISAETRKGILGRFPVTTIPNPVDTRAFRPIDKQEARARLGIPSDARAITFSIAGNTRDHRKGVATLLEALQRPETRDWFLIPLAITPPDDTMRSWFRDQPSSEPVHCDDDASLNLRYSAADLVWHPSLADTSSLVLLEAFASGTPAVAARVGGPAGIVREGATGFLFNPGDADDMIRLTRRFFDSDDRDWSRRCRRQVEEENSIDLFIERHVELYERCTAGRPSRPASTKPTTHPVND